MGRHQSLIRGLTGKWERQELPMAVSLEGSRQAQVQNLESLLENDQSPLAAGSPPSGNFPTLAFGADPFLENVNLIHRQEGIQQVVLRLRGELKRSGAVRKLPLPQGHLERPIPVAADDRVRCAIIQVDESTDPGSSSVPIFGGEPWILKDMAVSKIHQQLSTEVVPEEPQSVVDVVGGHIEMSNSLLSVALRK